MNKKFLSTLILISCLVSGCVQMPKPITDTKTSQAEINMIVRSLSYDGNNFRINKKLKSAKAGEPLKIAYISSSIFTDENERASSTADEVTKAVKNYLGEKANVSFVNCGIKGANSLLGKVMIEKILAEHSPDLIFVDFAGYEKNEQEIREVFEALLRECLVQENSPQIVVLISADADGVGKQDFMEQTARYYNLPIIDIANAFFPEISSGRAASEKFYTNNSLLTKYAQNSLADFIINYFKTVQTNKKDKTYEIPSPMYQNTNSFELQQISPKTLQADNDGSYVRESNNNKFFPNKITYLSNTGNNPFLFTINAKRIYLTIPVSSLRKDIAEIFINSKKVMEIDTKGIEEEDLPKVYKVYNGDKCERVNVAIKMKEEIKNENKPENSFATKSETSETVNTETPKEANEEKSTEQIQYKPFEIWGISYTEK